MSAYCQPWPPTYKTRADARMAGYPLYFPESPCPQGHLGPRVTGSAACWHCTVERSAAGKAARVAVAMGPRRPRRRNTSRAERRQSPADRAARQLERHHARYAADPLYVLKCRMRSLVAGALARRGYAKTTRTAELLGCTWLEFERHIELQFLPGMNWANRAEWHVDHITPMATATTEAEALALQRFTNLRPLWGPDNLRKGAQITHLL